MGKKILVVILCLAVLLSLGLVACSQQPGKSDNGEQGQEQAGQAKDTADKGNEDGTNAEEYKLPFTNEPVTFTWGTWDSFYPPASLSSGLEVWERIQKETGITIKWDIIATDYDTAMQTRLAAAQDLPDIIKVPGPNPTPYGQAGLLIPLEDLIEKYAPNIKSYFAENSKARRIMTGGDGHIYALAAEVEGSAIAQPHCFAIRKDWLDKLNLPMPNTIDDWYAVLKAFKEKDPNGNNKADEIPWGTDPKFFGEAFGLHLYFSDIFGGGFWADEDGKVFYQWTDPRMKELLTFANKLYRDGLLDPDYGNPSAEPFDAKVTKNLVGAADVWPDLVPGWEGILRSSGVKDAKFVPIVPPKGPNGEASLETYGIIDPNVATAITKDCEKPELAIKLLDYVYANPEGGRTYFPWGIEGKSFVVENGKKKYTDFVLKNPDGLGPSDALRTLGAWPCVAWIQDADTYRQILAAYPEWAKAEEMMTPYYVEPFPALQGTKEEEDQLTAMLADIDTYRKEQITKFIMGKEPLDKFDEYVETLKGMGLDEVVRIKQQQYDRYAKQ